MQCMQQEHRSQILPVVGFQLYISMILQLLRIFFDDLVAALDPQEFLATQTSKDLHEKGGVHVNTASFDVQSSMIAVEMADLSSKCESRVGMVGVRPVHTKLLFEASNKHIRTCFQTVMGSRFYFACRGVFQPWGCKVDMSTSPIAIS